MYIVQVTTFLLGLYMIQAAPQTVEHLEDLEYELPGSASEDCECVPFYQCEEKDNKIEEDDGSNIVNPRNLPGTDFEEEEDEAREDLKEVIEEIDEKYVTKSCAPNHVCCHNPSMVVTVKPYNHRCGSRNPGGVSGRILSTHPLGGEAEFGEWPWQAAILKNDNGMVFKCGGTLIDERHILTVAHCVKPLLDDKDKLIVRLGEWDTQSNDEFLPHEDYSVDKIIIHPQFKSNNLFNDIAILRLTEDVEFKLNIDTACLPMEQEDFAGQECIVTGWGTNDYKNGTYSFVMKEVTVPVLTHNQCQEMLRKTRLGGKFRLHPGFLCAGGEEGQDACKGDGGGPLVCYKLDNSYTVAGLVAWGIDCGRPEVPGVYVNVKMYLDWITSNTGKPIEEYWAGQI